MCLKYFRATHRYGYGQPIGFGPDRVVPEENLALTATACEGPQTAVPSKDDGFRASNGVRQHYYPNRRRTDTATNGIKTIPHNRQQHPSKTLGPRKSDMQDSHGPKHDSPKSMGDIQKTPPVYSSVRKNGGTPPRYKKNNEGDVLMQSLTMYGT